MPLLKYLSALLLLLGCNASAQMTNYIFDHLSTANVLSSNKTEAVIQDKDGFYWIATSDGLNKFDGSHCKVFRNDKNDTASLTNNQCTSLVEDNEGNIWVGTNKGVCKYDKRTNRFERFYIKNGTDEFDPLNRINSLCKDKDGNIWIGSFRLSVYEHNLKRIRIISSSLTNKSDYKKSPYSHDISYDAVNHAIWYRTIDGIRYYSIQNKKIFYSENNPDKLSIFQTNAKFRFAIASNKLWFYNLSTTLLNSLDLTTFAEKNESKIIVNSPRAMYADKQNKLWISSWSAPSILYNPLNNIIDSTFFKPYHDKSAVSGNIKSIYLDNTGNYWFCSTEGISIFNPRKQQYKYSILNNNQKIVCGVSTKDRNIIFSTSDGMVKYDPGSGVSTPFTISGIDNKKIKALAILNDTLAAGADDVTVFYDLKKKREIRRVFYDGTAQFIVEDHKNILWIGTWGKGLYKYDNKKNK